jgi:hypothetical protein
MATGTGMGMGMGMECERIRTGMCTGVRTGNEISNSFSSCSPRGCPTYPVM